MAVHGMIRVFAAAAIAEIILLLFLYERLTLPFIIVLSSIVSTGAVFLGLWITGMDLNVTAMMGMVMIVGIAAEMAVFLVSEYQALEMTMPPRQALYEAALNRLRPIVMSSLAMILAGSATIGSYTTFSTWMLETQRLGEERRIWPAVGNIVVSVVLGLAAAWLGMSLGSRL